MNFAFAPTTLTTGCRPIVFVTTPPHPASNARMMLLSDSVGGADDRRNGFSKRSPVNVVASWLAIARAPFEIFGPTRSDRAAEVASCEAESGFRPTRDYIVGRMATL